MPNKILSEIYIYPVKSLGGISVDSAIVETRGLKYDSSVGIFKTIIW